MARAGAAVVLFAVFCSLLVAPAPARHPGELPQQVLVVPYAVDRDAAAEPLLPKPVVDAEAANALTVPEEEVEPAHQAGQVVGCGGDTAVLSSSKAEPLSLDGREQAPRKGGVEHGQERPFESDSSDSDSSDSSSDDSDSSDSDSDDEDNEGGVMGWLWRLARRF